MACMLYSLSCSFFLYTLPDLSLLLMLVLMLVLLLLLGTSFVLHGVHSTLGRRPRSLTCGLAFLAACLLRAALLLPGRLLAHMVLLSLSFSTSNAVGVNNHTCTNVARGIDSEEVADIVNVSKDESLCYI